MTKDWDLVEAEIEDLYIKRKKPLKDVQRILFERYKFKASVRAFRMKFDEWGYRKNKKWCRRTTGKFLPAPSDDTESEAESILDRIPSPTAPRSPQLQRSDTDPGFEISGYGSAPSNDTKNSQRQMSLHDAVIWRRLNRVCELLSEGISAAARNGWSSTPLHYASSAIESKDDALVLFYIVKTLLDHGADPVAQDLEGRTTLHRWTRSVKILEYALPRCSNINIQTNQGDTPLHLAIHSLVSNPRPNVEAVSTLLKAGADVDIRNASGHNPFHLAVHPDYRNWYQNL